MLLSIIYPRGYYFSKTREVQMKVFCPVSRKSPFSVSPMGDIFTETFLTYYIIWCSWKSCPQFVLQLVAYAFYIIFKYLSTKRKWEHGAGKFPPKMWNTSPCPFSGDIFWIVFKRRRKLKLFLAVCSVGCQELKGTRPTADHLAVLALH